MIKNLSILGNLFLPTLAGMLFFAFFLYFAVVQPVTTQSSKYFSSYLITFCLFLVGRPFQLILGPHPIPLIINNLRVILLCAVCVPLTFLTTQTSTRSQVQFKKYSLYIVGLGLGMIYAIFNTLGTINSYEIFRIGSITAYDNFTPTLLPPFYGREVTIGIQIVIGLSLLIHSGYKIIKWRKNKLKLDVKENKILLFTIGTLYFGLALIFGSLAQQWALIYLGAMGSALIIGKAVLVDIKDVQFKMDKLIPWFQTEFFRNITVTTSENNIREITHLLDQAKFFDTCIILEIKKEDLDSGIGIDDRVLTYGIKEVLITVLGEEDFLILPLGNGRIAVCLAVINKYPEPQCFLKHLANKVRQGIEKRISKTVTIGIGRSYLRLEDLRRSYQEACCALDWALETGENYIVNVDDIPRTLQTSHHFSLETSEEVVQTAKLGKIHEIEVTYDNSTVERVQKAMLFMESNFDKPIAVEDVAKVISLSPSYFKHIFKQKTGSTFIDYLTALRMNKAKELLVTTNKSIAAIAYEVGYQDPNYFSRIFKNSEGISPSEYRD